MHNNTSIKSVTAFAPATCGNAIVGFDILGLAIAGVGDSVTLTRREDKKILIEAIDSTDVIPLDPQQNVASLVIAQLSQDLALPFGFNIRINKGIPLSSGMGGSAASAVAALTACNRFLAVPLSQNKIADYALRGEAFCSGGQAHPDNIVPAIYGGITLTTQLEPIKVVCLPIPDVMCVLIHPALQLATRDARGVLAANVSLKTHTAQSAHLAGFISALYQQDLALLQECLHDVIIEPQRADLIKGFTSVKHAALAHGALGASISGAGPSILALTRTQLQATQVAEAMQAAFWQHGVASKAYLSPISQKGAHITTIEETTCNSTAP